MRKRDQQLMTSAACAVAIAAMMSSAPVRAGDEPAPVVAQCDAKACLEKHFSDCAPATWTSTELAGSQIRYRIDGPGDGGCGVTLIVVKHPKPDWANKPLHMTLDPDQSFSPQMKDAFQQCLSNASPMDYQCQGPLRGARNWPAAKNGDGPADE